MLPGMERRLTEHMMVHHCAASEASGRSLQEVPLLKGSFGHHSAIGGLGKRPFIYYVSAFFGLFLTLLPTCHFLNSTTLKTSNR